MRAALPKDERFMTVRHPLAERPWGQSEFTVEDNEGNWLAFWQTSPTG
jgi:uncharacterized glyoxalase superfamily protein PhnB